MLLNLMIDYIIVFSIYLLFFYSSIVVFTGFVGTLILAVYYLFIMGHDWDTRWAHSLFFLGAMTCLAGSTIYHTFLCYSEEANRQLAK